MRWRDGARGFGYPPTLDYCSSFPSHLLRAILVDRCSRVRRLLDRRTSGPQRLLHVVDLEFDVSAVPKAAEAAS